MEDPVRVPLFCLLFLSLAVAALAGRPAIPPNPDVTPAPRIYVVQKDMEPLYACGNSDCAIVGSLERGERLAIQETVGGWHRVRGLFSGKAGWVNAGDVRPGNAKVTAKALNLRACPGLGCEVLSVLPKGQLLFVIESRQGWSHVRVLNSPLKGWVSSRYIAPY